MPHFGIFWHKIEEEKKPGWLLIFYYFTPQQEKVFLEFQLCLFLDLAYLKGTIFVFWEVIVCPLQEVKFLLFNVDFKFLRSIVKSPVVWLSPLKETTHNVVMYCTVSLLLLSLTLKIGWNLAFVFVIIVQFHLSIIWEKSRNIVQPQGGKHVLHQSQSRHA